MATKPKKTEAPKAEAKQPDPRTDLLRRRSAQKGQAYGRGQQRRFL